MIKPPHKEEDDVALANTVVLSHGGAIDVSPEELRVDTGPYDTGLFRTRPHSYRVVAQRFIDDDYAVGPSKNRLSIIFPIGLSTRNGIISEFGSRMRTTSGVRILFNAPRTK